MFSLQRLQIFLRFRSLLEAFKKRAEEHKFTPTVGRSHGIHAEPTTFGVKLAGHYAEFKRCRERLVHKKKKFLSVQFLVLLGHLPILTLLLKLMLLRNLALKLSLYPHRLFHVIVMQHILQHWV